MSTRQCDELCGLTAGRCAHGAEWLAPAPSVRREAMQSLRSKFKLQAGSIEKLDAILELEAVGLNLGLAARVLGSLPPLRKEVRG